MSDAFDALCRLKLNVQPFQRDDLLLVQAEFHRLRAELAAEQKRRYDGNEAAAREYAEQGRELSRYRAWHDAVMAQGHTQGLIVRPQPLKVKP